MQYERSPRKGRRSALRKGSLAAREAFRRPLLFHVVIDLESARAFSGNIGGPDGQNAPNITSDSETGIGTWSIADIELRLKTAIGLVFGPNATDDQKKKLISWMQGFAANAESVTTSAVETLILGASSVQTNSLIGAASGTAAGTIAKKATQHVYLEELGAKL